MRRAIARQIKLHVQMRVHVWGDFLRAPHNFSVAQRHTTINHNLFDFDVVVGPVTNKRIQIWCMANMLVVCRNILSTFQILFDSVVWPQAQVTNSIYRVVNVSIERAWCRCAAWWGAPSVHSVWTPYAYVRSQYFWTTKESRNWPPIILYSFFHC